MVTRGSCQTAVRQSSGIGRTGQPRRQSASVSLSARFGMARNTPGALHDWGSRSLNSDSAAESSVAGRAGHKVSTVIDLTAKRNLERLAAWQEYWQVGDRAADQRSARAMRRMAGRVGKPVTLPGSRSLTPESVGS